MGYYRGDYYRGDYYRGDLGGFFKGVGKVIGGGVKGFISGGPLGAIGGAVAALKKPSMAMPIATSAPLVPIAGTMGIGGAIKIGSKILTGIGAVEGAQAVAGFFGRNGNGGKRRTMNHLNPKALSRATRRVEGFVKKARKAVSPLGYTVVRRGSARCAPKKRCR